MDQRIRRLITLGAVALVCLILVTAPAPAQQRDPLRAAYTALGARAVSALHLKGFGTAYSVRPAQALAERWTRIPLASYEADIDFTHDAMRVRLVRDTGQPQTQPVWRRQQIWGTPQGFLKAARAARATVRPVPQGAEVSFTTGGQTFVGLINERNEVDRVQTWVDGEGRGDLLVETLFRDYEKTASGVWFPTHITQNHGSYPSLDVWLSAVAVNIRSTQGGRP